MSLSLRLRTDFIKERSIYRESHRNAINKTLHALTVPLEVLSFATALGLLTKVSLLPSCLNLALALYLYFALDGTIPNISPAKETAMIIHLLIGIASTLLCSYIQHWGTKGLWFCFVLQILAWSIQVGIGHGIFEKKSPSMTKSLTLNSVLLSLVLSCEI